jgi:hypothetical protein
MDKDFLKYARKIESGLWVGNPINWYMEVIGND